LPTKTITTDSPVKPFVSDEAQTDLREGGQEDGSLPTGACAAITLGTLRNYRIARQPKAISKAASHTSSRLTQAIDEHSRRRMRDHTSQTGSGERHPDTSWIQWWVACR